MQEVEYENCISRTDIIKLELAPVETPKEIEELPPKEAYEQGFQNALTKAHSLPNVTPIFETSRWEPVYITEKLPYGRTKETIFKRCKRCGAYQHSETRFCSWCGRKMLFHGIRK